MSSDIPAAAPGELLPPLDLLERRVLGVLVEKQKTSKSPDAYPMSLNALTTGANQKSNRDPVLNLNEEQVEEALARCQKKGLVFKITGGRVERWRHNLYDAWRIDKVELAVLAELLLRGPQTEGELRSRAARMEPIDDLDVLRGVLRPMAERTLVVYLTPEERRGAVLTHGFHDADELRRLKAAQASAPVVLPPALPTTPSVASPPAVAVPRSSEIDDLRQRVAALEAALQATREEFHQFKQSLGA
jgi:uncharacterized protein YceH (UPF0502 family)